MDCTTALERIQEQMDGRLSAAESAELDAHVAACPACAEERRAFAGLRTALRSLPAAKAPRGFSESVMAGVATAGPQPTPAAVTKPRGRMLRVRFALAAAVVAAAVVVVAVSTGGPPSESGGLAGTQVARNAASPPDDPVSRARRILDERVSGSGAPQDDAGAGTADESDAAKAEDAVASAAQAPPEAAGSGGVGDDRSEERKDSKLPATPAAPGAGAPPSPARETADAAVPKTSRGAPASDEQEKSAAPDAPGAKPAPTLDGGSSSSQVVYAVFATEADALAFVEGLRAAGVTTSERTEDRKDAAEAKDKRAERESAAPEQSGGVPASGGGGGGGVGGQRAASGAHGFGRGGAGYLELRRLSIGAMTAERRAVVDRAASAARGRLAESLVPQVAREPSDPPAAPRPADGLATPGGDAGGAPAKSPPAERAPATDADAQRSALPSPPATKAPAGTTLVIVVGTGPAPAGPTPPTKR